MRGHQRIEPCGTGLRKGYGQRMRHLLGPTAIMMPHRTIGNAQHWRKRVGTL
jgi:hypothetical protein